MTFRQRKVPDLILFCSIPEDSKTKYFDSCPQLISCASPNQTTLFIVFKAKIGYISILELEEGSIVYKHNIQIPYSYNYKITMLKLLSISTSDKSKHKLQNGVYLFVGYDDGVTIIYFISDTGNNKPLTKIFKIKPNLSRKQMVVNVHVLESSFVVITTFSVFIFRNIFEKQENNQMHCNQKESNESKIKIKEERLEVGIGNESKLNSSMDQKNSIYYIFNETGGAESYHISSNKQIKRVEECVAILCPCSNIQPQTESILAVGCTDDCVKFINLKSNVVQKFVGFKNFPSCFEEDTYNNMLWVGSLDGSIACFEYSADATQKRPTLGERKIKLIYTKKLCQNGIRKLMVHKKTLVALDYDQNIGLYDIIISEPRVAPISNR